MVSLKKALCLLISLFMAWSLVAAGTAYFGGALTSSNTAYAAIPAASAVNTSVQTSAQTSAAAVTGTATTTAAAATQTSSSATTAAVAGGTVATNVGHTATTPAACSTLTPTNITQSGAANLVWYRTQAKDGCDNVDNFFTHCSPKDWTDKQFVNEGTSLTPAFTQTDATYGFNYDAVPKTCCTTADFWRYRARFTFDPTLFSLKDIDMSVANSIGATLNGVKYANGFLPVDDNFYVFLHPTNMDLTSTKTDASYDRNFAIFFGGDGTGYEGGCGKSIAKPFTWNNMTPVSSNCLGSSSLDGMDWVIPGTDVSTSSLMDKYATCGDWTVEILLDNHKNAGGLALPTFNFTKLLRDVTIETVYTDPTDGTETIIQPAHNGYVEAGTAAPAADDTTYPLKVGTATIPSLSSRINYEIYYSETGAAGTWVDTQVSLIGDSAVAKVPLYSVTYISTRSTGGTGPDPNPAYAVNHTSFKLATNTWTRISYGNGGWIQRTDAVRGDIVNSSNLYPDTWQVDGHDLDLFTDWTTDSRCYGNVYVGPSTRRPIGGVKVTMLLDQTAIADTVKTDDNGFFSISPDVFLTDGDYTLYVTDPSGQYQDTYVTVQVAGNGFGAANIYMDPVSSPAAASVSATASVIRKSAAAAAPSTASAVKTAAKVDEA